MEKKTLFKKLIPIFIFVAVMIVCFSIDWITKYAIFDKAVSQATDGNYIKVTDGGAKDLTIIGTRSMAHYNSTMFSALNLDISYAGRVAINFTLVALFIIPMLFVKSKWVAFSLGVLVGGMLGNSLDVLVTTAGGNLTDKGYVRDIIFTPWRDNGTFNIADVIVVTGSGLLFLYAVYVLIFDKSDKEDKASKTKELDLDAKDGSKANQ